MERENNKNPDYYREMGTGYEPFDVIDAWKLDFYKGNALKYIARAGRKPGNDEIKELEKAISCLERRIKNLKTRNDGTVRTL